MDNIEKGYWIIANQKHLSVFKEDAHNIDEYESTIISGKAGLFLAQIRGHGRLPFDKAVRLARKVQISKVMLVDSILPKLKKATEGRLDYSESTPKGITEIEEHIDTESTLFVATSKFHEGLNPTDIDLGSLETLSHTAKLPRSESEIITLLIGLGMTESQAINCIKIQGSFELVKIFERYSLKEPVLFNEYIWRCDQNKIAHGISNLDTDQKQIIETILGMCEGHQGHPLEPFKNYQDVLNVADSVGLIDPVEIKTKDGVQKSFLFTPHLRSEENPTEFSNDLLGDVKLFLASMSFGEHYSKISRLGDVNREKTINFIKYLIRNREAGDATAIGIDYVMLEEHGIIRVETTNTPPGGRFKMVLLRPEIAKLALKAIKVEDVLGKRGILPLTDFRTKILGEGKYFTDVEGTRIQNQPYAQLPKESQETTNYYLKKLRGEV